MSAPRHLVIKSYRKGKSKKKKNSSQMLGSDHQETANRPEVNNNAEAKKKLVPVTKERDKRTEMFSSDMLQASTSHSACT